MAKPSLAASPEGVQLAKQALVKLGLMQKQLIDSVGCSRQPVIKFFKGEAVLQPIFIEICDRLSLNWQEVADLVVHESLPEEKAYLQPNKPLNLEQLVTLLRLEMLESIQEQCGTIRILDMSHPIEIDHLYIHVQVLEQLTNRRHRQIAELHEERNYRDWSLRSLGLSRMIGGRTSGIEAVEKYKRVIILGQPGAGKTTFLKHLAIQCNKSEFKKELVPIFISLKDFAEADSKPSLLEYIAQKNFHCYSSVASATTQQDLLVYFSQVFEAGRSLVLLDGLDEVRAEEHDRVVKAISVFSERFRKNYFVLTCRIAAWEYTFEKFTEIEVSPFDEQQIDSFSKNWFRNEETIVCRFAEYMTKNPQVKEMATSPLLLTLLCLAFEESGECLGTRAELYKEGIDALLRKWDAKRGIYRDQVYKRLSHQRKEDLLSYIAIQTFENGPFIKKAIAQEYIKEYISNLPDSNLEPEELQFDTEAILYSIEAQHGLLVEQAKGIYSFSHFSFHEYFAARGITSNSRRSEAKLEDRLKDELIPKLKDEKWREVFLLTSELLLGNACTLVKLMQKEFKTIVSSSGNIKSFLDRVHKQVDKLELSWCKSAAVRAFCFDLDFEIDESRSVALTLDRSANLLVCASFLARVLDDIEISEAIKITQEYKDAILKATTSDAVMKIGIQIALDSNRIESVDVQKFLKEILPTYDPRKDGMKGLKRLADQARSIAKKRRSLSEEWGLSFQDFSPEEKQMLKRYYQAMRLLVECMCNCMMTPGERKDIEDNLFLIP